MTTLYEPVTFGSTELKNRIVMAPLTRTRADLDGTPNDLLVEHYRQRAGLGLIIAEGTWPTIEGRTWYNQPGIATTAHRDAWQKVTDAVHTAGGKIFLQIMHGGRISHEEITGTGRIVAPSAIAAPNPIRIKEGKAPAPVPHALTAAEIGQIEDEFVQAAERAIAAGFDGIELHGANGYLINQFFSPAANTRDDAYGVDRSLFATEVTNKVADAIGADKVAIRLSPGQNIQGADETDPEETARTYLTFARTIPRLAFLHVMNPDPANSLVQELRRGQNLVLNTGFGTVTTKQDAEQIVAAGHAEAVSVGRRAMANPDLAYRWENNLPENELNQTTVYGNGSEGYTDYPAYQ